KDKRSSQPSSESSTGRKLPHSTCLASANAVLVSAPEDWIIDSGATHHYCSDKSMMKNLQPIPKTPVLVANGAVAYTELAGDVELRSATAVVTLRAYYVPNF